MVLFTKKFHSSGYSVSLKFYRSGGVRGHVICPTPYHTNRENKGLYIHEDSKISFSLLTELGDTFKCISGEIYPHTGGTERLALKLWYFTGTTADGQFSEIVLFDTPEQIRCSEEIRRTSNPSLLGA
jgi:hypothetical protein